MIKIISIVTKAPDWKKATLQNEAGAFFKDVSINAVSKKGEAFPGFLTLAEGQEIDGVLWESKAGGWYLFPPKENKSFTGAPRASGAIKQAMEKKEQSIGKFQDNKELSIKISSTMRMAVDCATAEWEYKKDEGANLAEEILKWRKFLWENWEAKDSDFAPFPTRTPDMRVEPDQRNITPEDIDEQFRKI